jgi:dihydrodipicolinate synthase/N-acetylneuraminate lyase
MRNGVYVANVTPFRADRGYTLDIEAYRQHVAWLAAHGVTGVAPFGSNGEGPSVSIGEKLRVLEALVEDSLGIDLLPVLISDNLPDTLGLLERIDDLPVGGVLVQPPHYFRQVADEGLRRFYGEVLEATRHPVLVYHIPRYSVPVPAELVASLPVWGVKNSSGDPAWSAAVHAAGKQVLVGTETDLVNDLADAFGSITALANIVPEQMVEMHRLVESGEREAAQRLSAHLVEVSELTRSHDSPGVLKVLAQARSGIAMGTVRPPLLPPPSSYDVEAALDRLQPAAAR